MIQDIAGNKYGKLTVLRYTGEKNKAGNAKWECLCFSRQYILKQ